jgi:hypothetical protein
MEMDTKTTNQHTKKDAITTTLMKLYERFAPEEVKGSQLETFALGGLIFQALFMLGMIIWGGSMIAIVVYDTFIENSTRGYVLVSGVLLGIPLLSFYLAQRIKNPGSRNHRIATLLLQILLASWLLKFIYNLFLF